MSEHITDDRLAELAAAYEHNSTVYDAAVKVDRGRIEKMSTSSSLARAIVHDADANAESAATCADTAAALRELLEARKLIAEFVADDRVRHAEDIEAWQRSFRKLLLPNASELDWTAAKAHFDGVRQIYQDMEGTPGVNTTLALRLTFDPISKRYNAGERTQELYDDMMGVR